MYPPPRGTLPVSSHQPQASSSSSSSSVSSASEDEDDHPSRPQPSSLYAAQVPEEGNDEDAIGESDESESDDSELERQERERRLAKGKGRDTTNGHHNVGSDAEHNPELYGLRRSVSSTWSKGDPPSRALKRRNPELTLPSLPPFPLGHLLARSLNRTGHD